MPIGTVLLFALAPALAGTAGAALAVVRAPGARLRSYVQHFAAGVVFAVVAVELLPELTRLHTLGATVAGFAAGVALMLLVRALAARLGGEPGGEAADEGERVSPALLVGTGVDLALDGTLVGVGFAAGERQGRLLAAALAFELASLGLALGAAFVAAGAPRARAVAAVAALGLLLPLGALAGALALRGARPTLLAGVLAFGAAALLYLATEELLVEAHETPETPTATALFFAGFLSLYVLELAGA